MKKNAKLLVAVLSFILLGTGCSSARMLVLHEKYACTLINANEIYCWGDNTYGQLGDGTNQHSNIPVRVALKRHSVSQQKQNQGWQNTSGMPQNPQSSAMQPSGWQQPQQPVQQRTWQTAPQQTRPASR